MPESVDKARMLWVKVDRVRFHCPLVEEWGEDGPYYSEVEGIAIYALSDYGVLYTNKHSYLEEETDENWEKLHATVRKINAHLAAGGYLDPEHWGIVRVTYGTQAYLDWVEPELVAHDKDPNYMLSALAAS